MCILLIFVIQIETRFTHNQNYVVHSPPSIHHESVEFESLHIFHHYTMNIDNDLYSAAPGFTMQQCFSDR